MRVRERGGLIPGEYRFVSSECACPTNDDEKLEIEESPRTGMRSCLNTRGSRRAICSTPVGLCIASGDGTPCNTVRSLVLLSCVLSRGAAFPARGILYCWCSVCCKLYLGAALTWFVPPLCVALCYFVCLNEVLQFYLWTSRGDSGQKLPCFELRRHRHSQTVRFF